MDFTAERQTHADCQFNRFPVQHGQRAGLTCANGTDIVIRPCSDGIDNFAPAKHF
jgi:hypothetical protein